MMCEMRIVVGRRISVTLGKMVAGVYRKVNVSLPYSYWVGAMLYAYVGMLLDNLSASAFYDLDNQVGGVRLPYLVRWYEPLDSSRVLMRVIDAHD